jgi:hypothetical protein
VAVIGSTVANVRLNDCKKVSRAKTPRAQRKKNLPLAPNLACFAPLRESSFFRFRNPKFNSKFANTFAQFNGAPSSNIKEFNRFSTPDRSQCPSLPWNRVELDIKGRAWILSG